jgi:hypothetical protein
MICAPDGDVGVATLGEKDYLLGSKWEMRLWQHGQIPLEFKKIPPLAERASVFPAGFHKVLYESPLLRLSVMVT